MIANIAQMALECTGAPQTFLQRRKGPIVLLGAAEQNSAEAIDNVVWRASLGTPRNVFYGIPTKVATFCSHKTNANPNATYMMECYCVLGVQDIESTKVNVVVCERDSIEEPLAAVYDFMCDNSDGNFIELQSIRAVTHEQAIIDVFVWHSKGMGVSNADERAKVTLHSLCLSTVRRRQP